MRVAARYRKIDPRIWTDEKFRQLAPDQQRIALYVLTAQSNRIGFFSFSPGKASEDLGLTFKNFLKKFEHVCNAFGWLWDLESRVVYIPTWWKYNPPENANNVVGNLKDLDDLPQNTFLDKFSMNTRFLPETLVETFTQTLVKRYPERYHKRSPSQEQEQEQEQEEERGAVAPTPTPVSNPSKTSPHPTNHVIYKGKRKHPAILLTYEPEWFERLWEHYPNGNGRKVAVEAWEKLKPDEETWDKIRASVKWQKKSNRWLEEDGRFVPMLATYLNQERWTDKEIPPSKPKANL